MVGDRKILRFLRGHDYHIEKVCEMVSKWLDFRKEHKVDEIRQNILLGGLDSPSKFPYADLVLKYQPQAVICPDALDNNKCPICVEKFNFSPSEVLKHITIPQYVIFFIHCLEFKSLICEQLSETRDQEYLNSLSEEHKAIALGDKDSDIVPAYGTLAGLCVIRDLEGIGFEHAGSQGQSILRSVISLASDNYPEMLSKCYVINSPWIFNTLWWFIQGLLAPKTVAKVSVSGTDFKDVLLKGMPAENIPNLIHGPYPVESSNTHGYSFNKQFFCPDMSDDDINALCKELHDKLAVAPADSVASPTPTDSSTSTTANPVAASQKETGGSGI